MVFLASMCDASGKKALLLIPADDVHAAWHSAAAYKDGLYPVSVFRLDDLTEIREV